MLARHFVCLLLGLSLSLSSGCDRSDQYGDVNVSANIEAADGLDLKAVGELVKQVKNAEELETKLNAPEGLNNLDLDADGKVDFIQVTEYQKGEVRGFSLVVEPVEGETQEIATIEVEKKNEAAEVYVSGNSHVYGPGHHYHYHHPSFTSMLLMSYMFRPHVMYMSPFHYGMYPGYYGGGYARVSRSSYNRRTRTASTNSTSTRSSARSSSSPNAGRNASKGIRSSLRNPTKSQRSFRTKNQRSSTSKSRTTRPSRQRSAPRRSPRRRR